ncbi:hypothetical protein KSK37_13145 [Kaistella sp. DKR-2]|uniref:DUF6438 domain-containing protein n=1 Tax=Kaistella soli TaxID=2849654 RepID=UPI001C25AE23|nr:DUF6438 domain-containing protein [Kaistella soli]MBU8884034.1 hypothetical protein [Kaistella soli]
MKYLLSLLSFILMISCATPNSAKYSKIQYEAGACFGFCPIFKLTVNPDRTAVIEAERFTFTEGRTKDDFSGQKEGTFKATIKQEDYDTLISKLDSLNLNSLKDYYGNKNVTDLPTSYLKITFADGTEKNIQDYGKHGTEKLRELYTFIEDMRKSQTWTKVKQGQKTH